MEINKSSVNPRSTSNQSSKPCTVLQYPSRKKKKKCEGDSSHIWMSYEPYYTYEWDELHIWMSSWRNGTCWTHEWDTSHTCDWDILHTYEGDIPHIWMISWRNGTCWTYGWVRDVMGHVGHMNETHHIYGWVAIHITHMNGTYSTYGWVRDVMGHVGHMNERYYTYGWVRDTNINASCHACEWVMSHKCIWRRRVW